MICLSLRIPSVLRAALLALLLATPLAWGGETPLTIFAAASLREGLEAQVAAFTATGAPAPRLVFAASSTLARQLQAGASAQLFISADQPWMDALAARRAMAQAPLLANRLALIAREGSQAPCEAPVACLKALPERLGPGGRLALGDPQHVPAGRYGAAALAHFGLLPALQDKLLPADNVRTALAWVARGEAALGLGYASDARVLPMLTALALIPETAHPPIIYPLGRLLDEPDRGATAFAAFLRSPEAQARWREAGFQPLPAQADHD
jgi:molybdate transport system substrate-binding protein